MQFSALERFQVWYNHLRRGAVERFAGSKWSKRLLRVEEPDGRVVFFEGALDKKNVTKLHRTLHTRCTTCSFREEVALYNV